MFHIAVIGAGQLGSRHLQGLYRMPERCKLYMVDPQQSSLDLARKRLKELSASGAAHEIVACTGPAGLPARLDLAIVATTSDVRLAVLERLLEHSEVKRLILEKVLFTREDEYRRAEWLLQSKGATAWVNCPRRVYDLYRHVRKFFSGRTLRLVQVQGAGWGLGCNGVHFADLFSYLSSAVIEEYDTRLLDDRVHASNRAGFVEFSGTLIGRAGGVQLWLTDDVGGNARHIITLRAEGRSCVIDETAGQAWFLDEREGWRNVACGIPYQSHLTGDVAVSILKKETCGLPAYEASAAIHLPFVRALTAHYARVTGKNTPCPIT